MKREKHHLAAEEIDAFERLPPVPERVRDFWRDAAMTRGLDPKSVLAADIWHDRYSFTALPLGHGKHWCWPMALGCGPRPQEMKST